MGQSPSSSSYNENEDGIPFFQGNADFGERYPVARVWCNNPIKVANPGDILLSVRAPIGALNYAKENCCIGRGLAALTPNRDKVLIEYVYWVLKSKNTELNSKGTGSTFKAISRKVLEETMIPDIDLERQQRCVEILEKLYRVIQMQKKKYRCLDELVRGRFVELFGNPVKNEKNWETFKLRDCLKRIDSGKSFTCDVRARTGERPAILKLSAITYGDYRAEENKALLDEKQFIDSAEIQSGDLLFTRKNTPELVGMAAYVYHTPAHLMMPDLIFRLVPNERMTAIFLWQLINNRDFRPVIQSIAVGSAKSMSNISKERLGNVSVICPPIDEQTRLNEMVHQINKSKLIVQKELDETQLLFDSLMQEYFG